MSPGLYLTVNRAGVGHSLLKPPSWAPCACPSAHRLFFPRSRGSQVFHFVWHPGSHYPAYLLWKPESLKQPPGSHLALPTPHPPFRSPRPLCPSHTGLVVVLRSPDLDTPAGAFLIRHPVLCTGFCFPGLPAPDAVPPRAGRSRAVSAGPARRVPESERRGRTRRGI